MLLYHFLNYFFFVFHTALILFNTLGWIFPVTRKWNLLTLLSTAFSWFILGAWYGWGFCFCTEWHWQVRERLGYTDMSNSYNHFLFLKLTGIDLDETVVDAITVVVFFISLALSIVLNLGDRQRQKSVLA
jgi:hypothetical protein